MSKVLKTADYSPVEHGLREIPVRALPPQIEVREEADSPLPQPDLALEADKMLELARTECEAMIQQASRTAEQMVERARADAEHITTEAREQGYQAGYEEGKAAAADAYTELIREGQDVVVSTERQRAQLLLGMHSTLTSVCMEAVRTLLNRELALHPADVETIVHDLLQYVVHNTKVEVRVHPSEFDLAMQAHPKWKSVKFGEWDVGIVPDDKVSPGGCEIRSEFGRVDARIETKLTLLGTALASAMERSVTEDVEQLVSLASS